MGQNICICFTARPAHNKFSAEIFKRIEEKYGHIYGGFITSNQKESDYIKAILAGSEVNIYEVSDFFRNYWNEFTFDEFVKYEKEYNCEPIWNYIYTDRFLIYRDFDYCVKITVGYFRFFENVFKNFHYDYYYDEPISTLQSYLGYIVGKKHGVKYISQTGARGGIDDSFHYVLADPYASILNEIQDYMNTEYSGDEVKRAELFLSDFENNERKPKYMEVTGQEPKFKLRYLLAPIKFLKYRLNKYSNDKYFYMYYENYKHSLDQEKFFFRYQISKHYYQIADMSKKYVYFPLHYQPESSTLVCAAKYEKQLFFIDSWAKSIPADTLLYVKEHYAVLGHRDLMFYKELKKYPNVVLVNPWVSSRELILNAVAVTTLTGTVGFEAMLLRKPIIISGNVFYENAPGVIKVDDIYQKYLSIMSRWNRPSREEVIKYICGYFRSLHEGNADCWVENSYVDENMDKIVEALYSQMINLMDIKSS